MIQDSSRAPRKQRRGNYEFRSPPPPARKLRRFHPVTMALEGRVPVSSLFPGISPVATTSSQPAVAPVPSDIMTETTTRETKAAVAQRVAPLPTMAAHVASTTSAVASCASLPGTGTASSPRASLSDTELTATNPIFAMAGPESTSPFYQAKE